MSDTAVNSPDGGAPESHPSDKEVNFRRLEAARDSEREARIRAEMQAQHMQQELENIKNLLQTKEADPLDGDDDEYINATKLRAKLEKERVANEKRSQDIARKTYEDIIAEDRKKNYLERLHREHSDYDQVMNESSIANLEKDNPTFVKAILKIGDEYERRKLAYEYIKSHKPRESTQSIKEKVAENAANPFHIPSGSGTPSAVEFDVKSANARQAAYQKLKAAQKRPIGTGFGPSH